MTFPSDEAVHYLIDAWTEPPFSCTVGSTHWVPQDHFHDESTHIKALLPTASTAAQSLSFPVEKSAESQLTETMS